ncbi:MAG: hypothetical protein ACTTKL_08370 [Treponema sp.]
MKKKTKSKSKTSLLLFLLVMFISFSGAAVNSALFYRSFFRSLSKMNEEPIATITFKYKVAQRKFLERVVWDRLRNNSPVYDGDTIHTAKLSEATIWFADGNVMELSEDTMAQVFLSKDKTLRAELSGGFAVVDSSESERGITLASGGTETVITAGSSVSAKAPPVKSIFSFIDKSKSGRGRATANAAPPETGALALQVIKGTATVRSSEKGDVSVAAGEGLVVGNAEELKPALIVETPLPTAKILYHTEGEAEIPFKWNIANAFNVEAVRLSVSPTRDFTELAAAETVRNTAETMLKLPPGNYFWKAALAGGSAGNGGSEAEEASGRIKIIQSLPPKLIAPAAGLEYAYRSKIPAVRFIWTERPYASAYKLEISRNANFSSNEVELRSSLPSSIVSTLQGGTYYWRVTPFYTINKEGFALPSETGTFRIEKKGVLTAPEIYVPADNSIVNIERGAKNPSFSWAQDKEAETYSVVFADNPELARPKIAETVSGNFLTFNPAAKNLGEGKWYWAVRYTDAEGNASPQSEVRSFYTLNGAPEQHTIEPADGYLSSETFMRDTKFSWRRNLPAKFTSEIQFSTSEDFNRILYRADVTSSSNNIGGLNFAIGTYYWRLKSVSAEDGITLVTPAKLFKVVENFPPPLLVQPKEKAVTRENKAYEFKWNAVPDADFYKFAIYSRTNGALMYEDNVWGTTVELDMFAGKEFIEKSYYRWEVQAQANAVPGIASRRTGKLAEDVFYLVKLRPVEVVFPKKNAQMDGAEAILHPIKAKWSSVDTLGRSQFVLRRLGAHPEVILKVPTDMEMREGKKNAPFEVLLDTADGLKAGTYEIVIYAETLDGIDVSNTDRKNLGRFSIKTIEPLPEAANLIANPALFNVDFLKKPDNPRSITLSWDKVPEATDYYVSVRDARGKVLLKKNLGDENTYVIDFKEISPADKTLFSKGTFSWRVEAVRRIDTDKDGKPDKILQHGKEAGSVFETDIPTPTEAKATGASNPYGN